jgi:hypothetical protein
MKNFKLITSIGLALTLVLASCSVEKRHYNKGYSVEWNSKAPKTIERNAQKPTEKSENSINENSASNTVTPVKEKPAKKYEIADDKQPDFQIASTIDEKTPAKVVKPYEYNTTQDVVDGAKLRAKTVNDLVGIVKNAEGSNLLSILAFIFGILAFIGYYAAFLFAIAAIILGAIALKRGASGTMRLFAILGIVFGALAILLWLILFILVFGLFAAAAI